MNGAIDGGRDLSMPGHHRSPLDVRQAATYLGVTERYVRRLISEHRIDYFKIGNHVRISPQVLDAYLEASTVAAISDRPPGPFIRSDSAGHQQ
jgi:excisionase family DNA binding protein